MGNVIEFESVAGVTVVPPLWIRTDRYEGQRGFAPSIQMEAEINGTVFAAAVHRNGGVDLEQPRPGAEHRRKKMLYINSIDNLVLFLQNVQSRAREYYGPEWGKE